MKAKKNSKKKNNSLNSIGKKTQREGIYFPRLPEAELKIMDLQWEETFELTLKEFLKPKVIKSRKRHEL